VVPHFIWERRPQEHLKSEPQFRVPGGRKQQNLFFGQILRAGIYFRQGAPLLRHPKEMLPPNRTIGVGRQLRAVHCQAHALQ
jgi:hypothetical protein